MAKTKTINLLPQEEFDVSIVGRVLKWAMGTFRIIVIVTEMIVMAAFLSRFWLDAQNSDLTESIEMKSSQISSQSDFEKEFRQIQKKLAISKALAKEVKPIDKVEMVTSKMPVEVILTSFTTGEGTMQIKGSAGSEIGIIKFIANLKSEKSFKTVELGSINSSEDNPTETVFVIKITY
jgi:Tfp pilus assembly protein PilN